MRGVPCHRGNELHGAFVSGDKVHLHNSCRELVEKAWQAWIALAREPDLQGNLHVSSQMGQEPPQTIKRQLVTDATEIREKAYKSAPGVFSKAISMAGPPRAVPEPAGHIEVSIGSVCKKPKRDSHKQPASVERSTSSSKCHGCNKFLSPNVTLQICPDCSGSTYGPCCSVRCDTCSSWFCVNHILSHRASHVSSSTSSSAIRWGPPIL